MMVIVIIAVGNPTVTGVVKDRPEAGGCSYSREGNLRNSESSNNNLSSRWAIPDGVSGTCILAGKKSADAATLMP